MGVGLETWKYMVGGWSWYRLNWLEDLIMGVGELR